MLVGVSRQPHGVGAAEGPAAGLVEGRGGVDAGVDRLGAPGRERTGAVPRQVVGHRPGDRRQPLAARGVEAGNRGQQAVGVRMPGVGAQLVALARALAFDPDVVLLDEPTASLELGDEEVFFRLVQRARRHGAAILLVSHRLSEVIDLADKIVVLQWNNYDCPYVKKHYEDGNMTGLEKKYREKGVVWLQICSAAPGKEGHFTGDALTERIKKEGDDAACYLIDEDGKVGRTYKARCTPHMFVIDKKGVLRYQGAIDSVSSAKKEDIEKATNYVSAGLDELLGDKVVSTKETKPYG